MKVECAVNLSDIDVDGWSLAELIADEVKLQIKSKVRKELKSDKRVDALVSKIKEASVRKLLADMGEEL